MNNITYSIFSFVFFVATTLPAADLETYKATYDKQMSNIVIQHGMKINDLGQSYAKSLGRLLSKVQKTGDLDKSTAVVEEIKRFKNEKSMPAKPATLTDIQSIQTSYARQEAELNSSKNKKILVLTAKYDRALEKLQKKLVVEGEFDKAKTVQAERKDIAERTEYTAAKVSTPKPKPKTPFTHRSSTSFNWKRDKKGLSYRYKELTFEAGNFDSTDKKCTKLTDNVTADTWGSQAVGWRIRSPSPIAFLFSNAVSPSKLKIHIVGKNAGHNQGNIVNIKIYTGDEKTHQTLLGETGSIDEEMTWTEVILKHKQPSKYFWIIITSNNKSWVMIDEVEFE